tara:strand:- start:670 stop:2043 length:1374 start_codon:yes stop_codon:yes gene_type:complete
MSEIKLHTCGNATLIIEKDSLPILATDPWLDSHTAYFGSWATTHKIPSFHLDLLYKVPYIWISHFHPDHLNLRSLLGLKAREKTILLSEQYSNRVANDLREAGMKVIVLPSRKFINLDNEIDIATFPVLSTVDSVLLIKCKKNLIINCNDTEIDPSYSFIKKQIAQSKHSLLLKLAGYGDADMINIYRNGKFIEPIAATKPAPGYLLTSNAKKLNCTHAMHFSSFHKYVRKDSLWANKYTTPEDDLERGWDKNIGYFKQFSSLLVSDDGFKKISSNYPEKNNIAIQNPEKYGDKWNDTLSNSERDIVITYLNKILEIDGQGFSIQVGGEIISPNPTNFSSKKSSFLILVPRRSLLRSIKSNIFDDLLIGNFAKVLIPENNPNNFRNILKVPSKYIDNAGISSVEELRKFLSFFRNSYDNKLVLVKSELKNKTRDLVVSKLVGNNKLLGNLKNLYQRI